VNFSGPLLSNRNRSRPVWGIHELVVFVRELWIFEFWLLLVYRDYDDDDDYCCWNLWWYDWYSASVDGGLVMMMNSRMVMRQMWHKYYLEMKYVLLIF
jgi:hypothetical protein